MRKALIVLIILLVPSLFFLWIRTGKNQYKPLEYYGPKTPVEKVVDGKTIIDTVYHTVGGFSLLDADSNIVTEAITKNKIVVADFFFTSCKTICPKMSAQFMRVQNAFKNDSNVVILSFTVDPENDRPSVLKRYAQEHNAIPGKWYFLTGEKKPLYDLAQQSYFVTAMEGDHITDDFIHSEQVILVDAQKHIRGIYDGTEYTEVNKLIEDVNVLLKFEHP